MVADKLGDKDTDSVEAAVVVAASDSVADVADEVEAGDSEPRALADSYEDVAEIVGQLVSADEIVATPVYDCEGVADTDVLPVWSGESVCIEGVGNVVLVPVNDAKEGVAKLVSLVLTDWLTLALPLKVHGDCEPTAELVLDTNGDLVAAEAVKLVVAEAAPDEVCDLTTVLVIEAEAETDFDRTAVAD